MTFAKLAEYLEKLEGTASRLEMTRILANLFKQTGPEDARLVAYMTQGRLGPAYKSPDFGVADKQMLKALGPKAPELFKSLGDLGKVAEEVSVSVRVSKLSIEEVYKRLTEIAMAGGGGSQEEKIKRLRDLVTELEPMGAKFAVKMVLGKLRTGFSDMTVLDSLSWMIAGDKSKRSEIEAMYNMRADLGEIAEAIVKYKKPKKMEPHVGTPILMARAERAKTAGEIWERNGKCAVEYKLDGLRIQAHVSLSKQSKSKNVVLFSRGLENVTAMFPDVVEGLKKQVRGEAIVEGEVIAVGRDGKFLPFQETVQRKRKYNIAEMAGKIPLKMFAFDVLWMAGKDVMGEGNEKRRRMLEATVKEGDGIKLMPRIVAQSEQGVKEYFKRALADGCEGIVAKKMDGPYQAGSRDFNWIKYKKSYAESALSDTIDAVVMGYDAGQGKRAGFGIGDFLIGVYDRKGDKYLTVAKVGTGLTDEEWKEMKLRIDNAQLTIKPENYEVGKVMGVDVWCGPKYVVEVQADEITKSPMHSSGYALRFPRFIGWREKKPEDATGLQELLKMFKMQGEGKNG